MVTSWWNLGRIIHIVSQVQLFFVPHPELLRWQLVFNSTRSTAAYLKTFPSAKPLLSTAAWIALSKQSTEVSGCDWNFSAQNLFSAIFEGGGERLFKVKVPGDVGKEHHLNFFFFVNLGALKNRSELKVSLLLIYLVFHKTSCFRKPCSSFLMTQDWWLHSSREFFLFICSDFHISYKTLTRDHRSGR